MIAVPLTVVVPLLVAAALAAGSSFVPRLVVDILSTLTAAVVTGLCVWLLARAALAPSPVVYAFGGWQPTHGIVLGILFVVDPLGAGLAALVGALMTAAFLFSWHYLREVRSLFHVLMLIFLAGMVGFCLTGDIFNLFVLFEVMGTAAYALTGFLIEDPGPIQGAFNFAITNSVGAFLILTGIALLYGRTGALNLAQIGHALAGHPADGLVIFAFVAIAVGYLVKAAVVPLHFWLADAHAVAPTPVCVLFSGVMVVLGVYAVFRVYWTVFAAPLGPHAVALRAILVALGTITALVGAVMCTLEHHLKRLLAFSTVSHVGMFVIGAGLLTPLGLAGAAVYVLAHAMAKGALFICSGILKYHFEEVDENKLRGRGRALPFTGALFLVGGLELAGLPPFGIYLGKGLIERAATTAGYAWVPVALVIAALLTAGAVLRAAGAIFLGWGAPHEDPSAESEGHEREPESEGPKDKTPATMWLPALALLVVGLALGLLPGMGAPVEYAAARFEDQPAYLAAVLGNLVHAAPLPALASAEPDASMVISGLIAAGGALAFALVALFRQHLPARLVKAGQALAAPGIGWLRGVHSGHIGDYVAWLILGVALIGVTCAFLLH